MERGLSGTYPMSVDSKLRVTLPSIMRKSLGGVVVLVPFGNCVYGFTPDGFEDFVYEALNGGGRVYNPRSAADNKLERMLRSNAVTVELDSAGRVALGKLDTFKPGRCEKLGVTGDVAIVGMGQRFEIWNAETFAAENDDDDIAALYFDDYRA